MANEVSIVKVPAVYQRSAGGDYLLNGTRMGRRVGQGAHFRVRRGTSPSGAQAFRIVHLVACRRKQVAKFSRKPEVDVISLMQRVEEEIALHWRLHHPNIVELHEVLVDELHQVWFVRMEYLGGGKTMTFLPNYRGYSADPEKGMVVYTEPAAAKILADVLSAIQYLHSLGIVHKDIKPENLLLVRKPPASLQRTIDVSPVVSSPTSSIVSYDNYEPDCKSVASFCSDDTEAFLWEEDPDMDGQIGSHESNLTKVPFVDCRNGHRAAEEWWSSKTASAKLIDFNSAAELEQDGLIWDAEGTRLFTPPECLRSNDRGADGKARDIWSIGCLAYCLLCGIPPVWADTSLQLMMEILKLEMPIFPGRRAEVPARLNFNCELSEGAKDFICLLMAVDPNKRITAESALNHPWIVRNTSNPQ